MLGLGLIEGGVEVVMLMDMREREKGRMEVGKRVLGLFGGMVMVVGWMWILGGEYEDGEDMEGNGGGGGEE